MHAASEPARSLRVRKMDFAFDEAEVPRWWLYGNPVMTHVANGLNLLFPAGERFFIRSVKHYQDEVRDPALRARIKGFFGQEGRHGHEHERANRMLEAQGYELGTFLARYERVAFGIIEPAMPPNLRLAATAAAEHYTAALAANLLKDDFIDGAHPVMAALLRWHAAEEIEHKSVAFDVLMEVDPRYWVRVAGLLLATSQLLGWWVIAARMLIAQEHLSHEEKQTWRGHAAKVRDRRDQTAVFVAAIKDYLRTDFHPDQRDDYALARDYLAAIGHL